MSVELFRKDSYLKSCESKVIAVQPGSVILEQTVFYPLGGGQPGDRGKMTLEDGSQVMIVDTQKAEQGISHLLEEGVSLPAVGDMVTVELDWERRHRLMRMHSCMHLLCSIVPFGVTGGSIREDSARLDFDAEQPMDKEAINTELNRLIQQDHSMTISWISEDELDDQPELVRTMSVQPPRGNGTIRLINFEGVDLQPCGGTHVNSTAEIGAVRIRKIEKKGKHNRRVNIVFDEG